jgi:hypothetical protein
MLTNARSIFLSGLTDAMRSLFRRVRRMYLFSRNEVHRASFLAEDQGMRWKRSQRGCPDVVDERGHLGPRTCKRDPGTSEYRDMTLVHFFSFVAMERIPGSIRRRSSSCRALITAFDIAVWRAGAGAAHLGRATRRSSRLARRSVDRRHRALRPRPCSRRARRFRSRAGQRASRSGGGDAATGRPEARAKVSCQSIRIRALW